VRLLVLTPSLGFYEWSPTPFLFILLFSPLPDESRLVYFNVNGLEGFKFAELLLFMAIEAVDGMVLIDVCIPNARVPLLCREARAQLGPRAECLVSVLAPPEEGDPQLSIKVGGNNRSQPQMESSTFPH